MPNIYLLINKYQLNNRINSEVNIQKMQIPVFTFYSEFSCEACSNSKLVVLQNCRMAYLTDEMFNGGGV